MTTPNILAQGPVRYIVMDAPGWHGDYAMIYSSHSTLEEARQAWRRGPRRQRMITTDGGWNATHQKGDMIHRQFTGHYVRY